MHTFEKNIVEIRNEYMVFIINILTPMIYEGIYKLYNQAVETDKLYKEQENKMANIKNPGILKIFQCFLKDIQNLNDASIKEETNRIRENSKCSEYFNDLIKAVIKSNIVLLTYNASDKKCMLIEEKFHDSINIELFIHTCYIESGRVFFNNPELFWHEYPTIEIKKNQRECFHLIQDAIKEAIRKMLPMKRILQEYLSKDYIDNEKQEDRYVSVKQLLNNDSEIPITKQQINVNEMIDNKEEKKPYTNSDRSEMERLLKKSDYVDNLDPKLKKKPLHKGISSEVYNKEREENEKEKDRFFDNIK